MTARERLRRVAEILEGVTELPGLSSDSQETIHAHAAALRALADRIDAELAGAMSIRYKENVTALDRYACAAAAGVLARLDAPLPGAPLEGEPR